jgi:hypothetical protein
MGELDEDACTTDRKVREFFINEMHVDNEKANNMAFQAVHRLHRGPKGKHNILIRFGSLLDKALIQPSACACRH